MKLKIFKVSTEWSNTPGGRYKIEGKYSGEEFRDDILEPLYTDSRKEKSILVLDMNGSYGYADCWLEEVFGGLVRKYKEEGIFKTTKINFISDEDPSLLDKIAKYIIEADEAIEKRNFELDYSLMNLNLLCNYNPTDSDKNIKFILVHPKIVKLCCSTQPL